MLIIRGVNVFPSQIEDVILKQQEFEPHFLLTNPQAPRSSPPSALPAVGSFLAVTFYGKI